MRAREWIRPQRLFFVGSAPLDPEGHVNVSPKGPIESLRASSASAPRLPGHGRSGAETAAHVRENGRIVVMLCAFEGPPRIVRLQGARGSCSAGRRFAELLEACGFADTGVAAARRAIMLVQVARIADSCGYWCAADELRGAAPAHGRVGAEEAARRRRARAT